MTATHVAAALSVATAIGLVAAALLGTDGVGRHEQLRQELQRVRTLNTNLKRENRRLAAERRALRHDAAYIDTVIRDDLGYVRADEVIFEIEDGPGNGAQAVAPSASESRSEAVSPP